MAGNVSYTLDDYIIPAVVRLSHLPTANVTFQSADIAALCDGEISTDILKTILSTREGFYLRSVDLTADSNGIGELDRWRPGLANCLVAGVSGRGRSCGGLA